MSAREQSEHIQEPQRIRNLRRNLIKMIPRFPNDRTSLQHIQKKRLNDLLIDYFNWRSRYVGVRPRTVIVEPAATLDTRWTSMFFKINLFLDKVRRGDDLTAYLSIKPHTQGYTPKARRQGASSEDKWLDKDFELNTKGYHHFHLGELIENGKQVERTDELIFAQVTRDTFTVIAIFSHDVFVTESPENRRFNEIHQCLIFRGHPPGTVLISNPIATSGHALHVVFHARRCVRVMGEIEPKLNDMTFVESLYPAHVSCPAKPKLGWGFVHLDLAIYDMEKRAIFVMLEGWN